MGQISRVTPAQLQCDSVLFGIEAQMPLGTPMAQRARGHHFGVKQGVAGQQAMEETAMAVGPIHHGGNGQTPGVVFQRTCAWRIACQALMCSQHDLQLPV
jgi:hypothetical protein